VIEEGSRRSESLKSKIPRGWLTAWPILALALAAVGALWSIWYSFPGFAPTGMDFRIYRGSLTNLFSGTGLYTFEMRGPGQLFSFTYPPFAAMVLSPFVLATPTQAQLAWVLLQYPAVFLLAVLVRRETPAQRYGWTSRGWLIVLASFSGIVLSRSVVTDIRLGQISMMLVVMVIVDFLVLPPKWRGLLVGIAAAIKLTPLIFLVYFVVTKQWRAVANAAGAAAAATLLAVVVLPGDSLLYWTKLVFDTSRVGDTAVWRNKSLLGFLTHWGIGGGAQRGVWLVLVLGISAIAFWRAYRHFRRGEEFAAVLVVGLLATVISPISWWHHLVWISVAGVYLALLGRRVPALIGVVLVIATLNWSPLARGYRPNLWADLVSDVICLVPVAICVFGLPRKAGTGEDAALPAAESVPD
jgi:alpha-1,2-mannosyltransferase